MKKIYIPIDQLNSFEQFSVYQRDGETIKVPKGKFVEVPDWLAERALEIGEITEIIE